MLNSLRTIIRRFTLPKKITDSIFAISLVASLGYFVIVIMTWAMYTNCLLTPDSCSITNMVIIIAVCVLIGMIGLILATYLLWRLFYRKDSLDTLPNADERLAQIQDTLDNEITPRVRGL